MHIYLSSSFQLNARYHTVDGQVLYRTHTPHKGVGSTTTISKVIPSSSSRPVLAPSTPKTLTDDIPEEPEEEPEPDAEMQNGSKKWGLNNPFRSVSTPKPGGGDAILAELEEEQQQQQSLKPTSSRYADADDMLDMRDTYVDVAEVKWSWFAKSAIRYFPEAAFAPGAGNAGVEGSDARGGQDVSTDTYFGKTGFGPYGRHRTFTASNNRHYKWKMGWWTPTLVDMADPSTPLVKVHRKRYGLLKRHYAPKSDHAARATGDKKLLGQLSLEIVEGHGTEAILDEVIATFVYVETIRKRRERASRSSGGS